MSATERKTLHLSVCDCPHVNIVILDADGRLEGHFATGADKAEQIGRDLLRLAAECRVKEAVDVVGAPRGRA